MRCVPTFARYEKIRAKRKALKILALIDCLSDGEKDADG
jgi:hypothetical protein